MRITSPSKRELLTEMVRDALTSGEFKTGDRLPSENQLSDMYGVSHMTVREAVGTLVQEGLVVRIHGKGTFVAERKSSPPVLALVFQHLYPEAIAKYTYDESHLAPIIRYAIHEARLQDANILLYLDDDSADVERENLERVLETKPDALLLFYIGGEKNMDCLERIQDAGIPIVCLDRYVEGIQSDYVVTDAFTGGYQATRLLIDRGFSSILHFTVEGEISTAEDRFKGYRRALSESGLQHKSTTFKVNCIQHSYDMEKEAYSIAMEALDGVDQNCAIFAVNAPVFMGVWKAVREKGLNVSSMSFAYFDRVVFDVPNDSYIVQVIQPSELMGRTGVRVAIDRIAGRKGYQHLFLSPTLLVADRNTSPTEAVCSG